MAEIRDELGLDRDDLPDYSTIYKSFDRLKMWVWPHRARQHVLRPSPCVVVVPPAVGKLCTDAESDDIN